MSETRRQATQTSCVTAIILLLISNGADMNGTGKYGRTLLDYALYMKRQDVVEILSKLGACEGSRFSTKPGRK